MTTPNPDYIQVSIPRLTGYKTIVINAVQVIGGILVVFLPGLILPQPEQVGLAFDTLLGAYAIIIGVINVALRLMTSHPPAAPVNVLKLKGPGGGEGPHSKGEYIKEGEGHLVDDGLKLRSADYRQGLWDGMRSGEANRRQLMREYLDGLTFRERDVRPYADQLVQQPGSLVARLNADLQRAHETRDGVLCDHANAIDFSGTCRFCGAENLLREPDDAVTVAEALAYDNDSDAKAKAIPATRPAPYPEAWKCDHGKRMYGPDAETCEECKAELGELNMVEDADGSFTPAPSKSNGQAFRAMTIAFLMCFAVGFTGTLAGCAAVQQVNAVAAAETAEQRAFALYSSYTILQERAADIVRDTSLPKDVRKRIQAADRVTHPAAQLVLTSYRALQAARTASQGDEAGIASVEARTKALGHAVTALAPRIEAMSRAINAARG